MSLIYITPRMVMAITEMAFKRGAIWKSNGSEDLNEALSKCTVEISDFIEEYYNQIDHIDNLIGDKLRSGELKLVNLDELLQQVKDVEGVKVDMECDTEEKYLPYILCSRTSDDKNVDDLIGKIKSHCDISSLYLAIYGEDIE